MGNKTVIVILGVAALLLGFIFFFERDTMTTGERKERDERVFKTYKLDLVDSFTIEATGGSKVTVNKVVSVADEGEERWEIASPRELTADEGEVRSVLSAIDYLIASRLIKGKEERGKEQFGLISPRLKASFTIRGEKTLFVIGADAKSEAVYLAVTGVDDEFYAVEEAFFESVNKTMEDLRSKKLVANEFENVVDLKVERTDGGYSLRREKEGPWQIEQDGNWVLAAADQVDELVKTVNELEAQKFVKAGSDEQTLTGYGLATGSTSIEMQSADGKKLTVRVGSICPGEAHQVHVVVKEIGEIACIDDGLLQVVSRPVVRLRETRPAVFLDGDVTRVTVAQATEELSLTRGEEGWLLASDATFPLDQGTVSDLLGALRETRASSVEVGADLVSNLGEPAASITLELIEEEPLKLDFFRDTSGDGAFIRRGEEAALLTVPGGLLDQVRSDTLAFRKRKIVNGDPFDIQKLTIEGPVSQRLVKVEGAWKLKSPHELEADVMGARRVAELVAEVEALRFVSKVASKEHGFTKPFASITAEFVDEESEGEVTKRTSSKKSTLELGATTKDGGRFARFKGEDETVFVLGESLENAIANPLVARDLLQIDETDVVAFALEVDQKELVFKKQGEKWAVEGDEKTDLTKFSQLIADLGGIKAVRTDSFIGVDPNDTALLTLQIWNKGRKEQSIPTVIKVTEKTSDSKENGYFACRDGIPVTFVLPARIVDDFIALSKSSTSGTELP